MEHPCELFTPLAESRSIHEGRRSADSDRHGDSHLLPARPIVGVFTVVRRPDFAGMVEACLASVRLTRIWIIPVNRPCAMNPNDDKVYPFHLQSAAVRGHIVHLESSWREILAHADYSPEASALLGESLAASVLFAGALKFEGSLSIQLRGAGALRLLFAECTHAGDVRGIARCDDGALDGKIDLGQAGSQLAITIENTQTETRYQGLVPIESRRLAEAFEGYFERSEQLPTRIMLVERDGRCAGIMLQRMADSGGLSASTDTDAWNRVGHLLATLSDAELLDLPVDTLLLRLFHEEGVVLHEGRPLRFNCSCSRERVLGMLRSLGRDEALAGLDEQGELHVTCEFCNRDYLLDEVDLAGQFAEVPEVPGPSTVQ